MPKDETVDDIAEDVTEEYKELTQFLIDKGLIESTVSISPEEHVYVVQLVEDMWLVTSTDNVEKALVFHMSSMSDETINGLLTGYKSAGDTPVTVESLKANYEEGWKNIAVELMYDSLQVG